MPDIKTIVVATDFSTDADSAVQRAVDLAKGLGARLHLVHAYPQGTVAGDPFAYLYPVGLMESIERNADRRLLELRPKLEAEGLRVTHEVRRGAPSEQIVEAARAVSADLIVVGTRGLTGIRHAMLGSVAERVVRHAGCPVLTVKAKA
jgi:nucleotide-binding universal stress UspA family protein